MQWVLDKISDVIDFMAEVYTWFREMAIDFFDAALTWLEWAIWEIIGHLWDLISHCIEMVWDFFLYIYDLILGEDGFIWYAFDFALFLGNWIYEQIPDVDPFYEQYRETFVLSMTMISRLNEFLPLTEWFYLTTSYIVFKIGFLIVKFVMKVIPLPFG